MNLKKLCFALAFVLMASFSFAAPNPGDFEGSIIIKVQEPDLATMEISQTETTLTFNSIKDFQSFKAEQLNSLYADAEYPIKVTVSVKTSSDEETHSKSMSATDVKGEDVSQTINLLRKQVKATNLLKN